MYMLHIYMYMYMLHVHVHVHVHESRIEVGYTILQILQKKTPIFAKEKNKFL